MRTVIVGASTGLGRCIGIGLAKTGDDIALLARSQDLLTDAAKEAGPGTVAITCDVTDETSVRSAIDEAARALGGIDAVVYSAGIGILSRIEDLDVASWQRTFATNVIGASLVTSAALPYLTASHGAVLFLSSISASQTPPWPGLSCYSVTKAALDRLVMAWHAEHPEVGFTRVVVGDCGGGVGPGGSHLTSGWDMELAAELFPVWTTKGLLSESLIDVDELVDVVGSVLRCGASASIPSITLTPRRPAPVDQ
jgi:NAD(P)-dependent dehydrogenase (short-subunit alcohol dehydrogenase family)